MQFFSRVGLKKESSGKEAFLPPQGGGMPLASITPSFLPLQTGTRRMAYNKGNKAQPTVYSLKKWRRHVELGLFPVIKFLQFLLQQQQIYVDDSVQHS